MLLGTAWLQVSLVAINVYQVANHKWIGAFIIGSSISFIWAFNVSKIAFGGTLDKLIYALGAGIGTITGMLIAQTIYT